MAEVQTSASGGPNADGSVELGRLLSPQWLTGFRAVFRREMPGSMRLSLLPSPALVYAYGRHLEAFYGKQPTPEEVRALIGELCTGGR